MIIMLNMLVQKHLRGKLFFFGTTKKTCAAALKTNVYPENDACRRRYFPFEEGSHGQHALIFTVFLLQTSRVRSSNFQAGGQ